MIIKKRILAAMLATPAALAITAPAQAQVSGIASANPAAVVANSKALTAAHQQISTTYKAAFDQMQARRQTLETEMKPLIAQVDTNKDGQVSEAELAAAQSSKSPAIERIRTAQTNAQTELSRLSNPAARAELFAIESVLRQYEPAMMRVVTARKISVVLAPEVFQYAPDSADISTAITAEIDKTTPTVSIQPPANWQPSRDTMTIQQQIAQAAQARAYQQAAQQQGAARPAAAPAAAPAANTKRPAESR